MKKLLTLALTTMLVCALVLPAMGKAFPDVPENHWAYKAVEELYAAGLVIGYPDGTFGGQRSLTRYEYAEIVARLYQRLQEIAAESNAQADKALEAAMTAQDMAKKAQLAADAAAKATPVERIIEKHIIETKPDIPYEEVYKQARDLAVLVESLQEEFAAEIAELQKRVDSLDREVDALDSRMTNLEVKVGDLDARQTRTEAEVAQIKADREKFKLGGTFEATLEDRSVNGSANSYKDPYKKDFDGDDLDDAHDYYKEGVTLEGALTLNMGFKPAEGIDVKAKVKLTDSFAASDSNQQLNLKDVALEATSDGIIRRAYYGNVDSYKAFDGYSRFIKTRTEFINEREDKAIDLGTSVSIEGAQIDLVKGNLGGQFAVLGNRYDVDYYILSRAEYAFSPSTAVGFGLIRTANASNSVVDEVNRTGAYLTGNAIDVDYRFGVYNSRETDTNAFELSLARPFSIFNVGVDYISNYAEDSFTMVSAKTNENIILGSLPLALSGEYGFASDVDSHYKVAVNVVDFKLGVLNVGGGFEMVKKDTDDDWFEVAVWDDNSADYNKFSVSAGFDHSIGSVKFTPGIEWYTKDVTENNGDPDHKDSRTTVKIGFATPAFNKGTLTGAVKRINDTGFASGAVVKSNATGIDANFTYPIGAVDLTVGAKWLDYEETEGNKHGDYDYLVLKSGVKFDF